MAQTKKSWLVTGWRRYAVLVVAVLVLAILVSVIWGKDIRVWWVLQGIEDDREKTLEQLRLFDLPYRDAIRGAVLRGGRILTYQADLCGILLGAPYYDRDTVEGCLADEDPVIRRAAAMALLRHDVNTPAGPVTDAVLEVLRDWGEDSSAMWLDGGLAYLSFYRDKRLAPILLSIVTDTTPDTEDLQAIARSNSAREVAAQRLAPYIDEPGVIEQMRVVLAREKESEYVKLRVLHTFLKGGYSEDLEVFWMAARHENPHIRQVLADNLEFVKDPGVIPVLEFLLDDTEQVVRRGAVLTLARKRHPVVMDDIHYLAEDSYGSIKGDLAEAVKDYRRDDLIPFVVWCLSDYDPVVVEKAIVTLGRMARTHHEFDWERYKRIGRDPLGRMNLVK
ncbi:MAG: HEAT repeat domain-containing protein, partial [Planctomycetota bacterium]